MIVLTVESNGPTVQPSRIGTPALGEDGHLIWLFAGSDAGGETLADAMTVIETVKLSGRKPEAYLADVLARINDHPITRLDELLPWNWSPALPDAAQAA